MSGVQIVIQLTDEQYNDYITRTTEILRDDPDIKEQIAKQLLVSIGDYIKAHPDMILAGLGLTETYYTGYQNEKEKVRLSRELLNTILTKAIEDDATEISDVVSDVTRDMLSKFDSGELIYTMLLDAMTQGINKAVLNVAMENRARTNMLYSATQQIRERLNM